jgi:O-antigen/teichoic acid export membrane protein
VLALYFKYLPVKDAGNEKCKVSYSEISKFSLPLFYVSLWGFLIESADQFFISRYFGPKIFAEFSNGSMELPFIGMIVGACSTVLLPVFSKMANENSTSKKEIFTLWISVFEKTSKIIYPLVLYCWIFADILMVVLYGNTYKNSSIYFRIKSLEFFFTIISYPTLAIAIGKVRYYANVIMYGAIVLIGLDFFSIWLFNSPYAIMAISVICKIGRICVMLLLIAKFLNRSLIKIMPIRLLLKILASSIIILFILHYLLIYHSDFNKLSILIIGFIAYIVIFYISSLFMRIDYLSIIRPLIRNQLKK